MPSPNSFLGPRQDTHAGWDFATASIKWEKCQAPGWLWVGQSCNFGLQSGSWALGTNVQCECCLYMNVGCCAKACCPTLFYSIGLDSLVTLGCKVAAEHWELTFNANVACTWMLDAAPKPVARPLQVLLHCRHHLRCWEAPMLDQLTIFSYWLCCSAASARSRLAQAKLPGTVVKFATSLYRLESARGHHDGFASCPAVIMSWPQLRTD